MDWQCVFLCWGDKYNSSDILSLVSQVKGTSAHAPKFILITDAIKDDLPEFVEQILLPPFYNQEIFKGGGCQAKISLFKKGILEANTFTIYIDLDTAIFRDIYDLKKLMKHDNEILMFKASFFRPSNFWRLLSHLTRKKIHVRGNSSIIAFLPAHHTKIAEAFETYFQDGYSMAHKPLRADDRFISWFSQQNFRTISNSFAVKFRNEYMGKFPALLALKTCLPWVEKRREKLAAITFPGLNCKPSDLVNMNTNEVFMDHRGRKLIWSQKYIGATKMKIEHYFSNENDTAK